jgi:heavy metal translocating P-type ATPase
LKKTKSLKPNISLLIALLFFLVLDFINILPKRLDIFFLQFIGIVATLPVIKSAYFAVKNKKISVDLLAGIALLVSLFNQEWTSVVFINLMITSARIFGDYSENRAQRQIKGLLKLRPLVVKIKRDNQIIEENLSALKEGDLVVIDNGERIPVDGVVEQGEASVDQSSLTGESIPVPKIKGSQVYSSTLNVSGSLLVKAIKVGKDTSFEKIIKLVESAQENKVGINTLAEKFASWYILSTLIGSIILYIFTKNFNLLLSLLLVTCADDIAVAIPIAFWISIGQAAKRGIIIKGSNFLEGLTKVKIFIFDKTGTLTKDKIKIEKIICFSKISEKLILEYAAIAESVSKHPIANAIVEYANLKNISFSAPKKFKVFPSRGVVVNYLDKHQIVVGSYSFIKEQLIKIDKKDVDQIIKSESLGYNVVIVVNNNKVLGIILLGGELRPDIKETFSEIKKLGIDRIVMLTGDNFPVAKNVADKLGIKEFYSDLLPEDKLNFVRKNLSSKYKLAYVGDGVNDAASIAQADVGIVMGAIGSDSAVEAADIALMDDNFTKIDEAINLGHYVLKIAKENFIIWGTVNLIGLFLVLSKVIGPEGAALYNFATDFIPLMNSFRLFGFNFDRK